MASSTRQDVISRVLRRLRVGEHSDMAGDLLSLNNNIDEIATDISRRTRCYMTKFTTDITGSTSAPMVSVCMPEHFEVTSLLATWGTASTVGAANQLLRQINFEDANAYIPQWQQCPAFGYPYWFIYEPPLIYLYPQPNYACSAGLVFDGYAAPLASWQNPTDSPAVPERVVNAIVDGAAGKWAMEYADVPGMAARSQAFLASYEEQIGLLEAEVNRQNDRSRTDRRQGWGYF